MEASALTYVLTVPWNERPLFVWWVARQTWGWKLSQRPSKKKEKRKNKSKVFIPNSLFIFWLKTKESGRCCAKHCKETDRIHLNSSLWGKSSALIDILLQKTSHPLLRGKARGFCAWQSGKVCLISCEVTTVAPTSHSFITACLQTLSQNGCRMFFLLLLYCKRLTNVMHLLCARKPIFIAMV